MKGNFLGMHLGALVAALCLLWPSVRASWATQLVSPRNSSISPTAGGNGGSTGPVISPDGRFVVYTSTANNLLAGQNNLLISQVFLYDRSSNTTALVSVNTNGTGGNGHSGQAQVSADGRYVVFVSSATDLVPVPANGLPDIYERDMLAGTTTLISVATNGGRGNGLSIYPVMTPDGRYVAFLSEASNLVANYNSGIEGVFVRDTVSGQTVLASDGAVDPRFTGYPNLMDTPAITPDGRYVVFYSEAGGLGPTGTYYSADIYVRDLAASSTIWITSNMFHTNNTFFGSMYPSISDDGTLVSFEYLPHPNFGFQVFQHSTQTQLDNLISSNVSVPPVYVPAVAFGSYHPPQSDFDIYAAKMTPDGRYIAYLSLANSPATQSVHVVDTQTMSDILVSRDLVGSSTNSGNSDSVVITPDGRYVTFLSMATNLVTNQIVPGYHIYQRDMVLSNTVLVDVDTNGAGSVDVAGTGISVSTNGEYVVFAAPDGALVPGDANQNYDVFLRDVVWGTTTMISQPAAGVVSQTANGLSWISQTGLSSNGQWLVFTSAAEDLVTNDGNGMEDVFVRDLQAGTNGLVSVGLNGMGGQGGFSDFPSISSDGRYVVFVSGATNLCAGISNFAGNIFERDLQLGVTTLVDVDATGALLGAGNSTSPSMSANGRYVAFLCQTNIGATPSAFWRDTAGNVTVLITNASALTPSISADGRYVAYSDSASHPYVWDSQGASNIYSSNAVVTGIALSPTGGKLALASSTTVQVVTVTNGAVLMSNLSAVPMQTSSMWSADERFFAFCSATALINPDTNLSKDVYLEDFASNTLTLVSANQANTSAANAASDMPCLTPDGRWMVFRSWATDIVPGATNAPNVILFDRLTGTKTLLTIDSSPLPVWSTIVAKPAISAAGNMVAFSSPRASLVPGTLDLNRTPDVFATGQLLLPTTDSVGDGIPDWWRAQYFGGNGTMTNSQSCATCDADGDGVSNMQEFLAGTSPTSAGSVLKVQFGAVVSGSSVTLTWPAAPNKGYTVQYKVNLTDPTWQTVSASPWVVGNAGYCTVPQGGATTYYRVLVVN